MAWFEAATEWWSRNSTLLGIACLATALMVVLYLSGRKAGR